MRVFWRFADKNNTKKFGGKAVKSPQGFPDVDCLFLLAGASVDFAEGGELGVWSSAVCFPAPRCKQKRRRTLRPALRPISHILIMRFTGRVAPTKRATPVFFFLP